MKTPKNRKMKLKSELWQAILIYLVYLFFIFVLLGFQCMAAVICQEKEWHKVLIYFPGSRCGQICATQNELVIGYISWSLIYFILPFIIIYFILRKIHHYRNGKKKELPGSHKQKGKKKKVKN